MPPSNVDLSSLLSRVALGDRVAFERLYGATCSHLLSVAFRILNSRDRAEEVLQEAFINVWQSAHGYNAGLATPMTWLINVVRNKAIDAVRSGRALRGASVPMDEEALAVAADTAQEPQHLLNESLVHAQIHGCMAGLTAPQRQALALAYYQGMVHTDIAAALNAPLGTAKAWVRRGLDRLKDCLQSAGVSA
jgi:RNA polymerase sigma-70 factor (ECF subfamily)